MAIQDKPAGILTCFIPAVAILAGVLAALGSKTTSSPTNQETNIAAVEDGAEPTPPAGQTYVGNKVCASCHFQQYSTWKTEKHATAFEILPEKYKSDASCLECHTTGFGQETGFKTAADTHLAGTTCEACHGPGSKHQQICKDFSASTTISAEQEKQARDSIYLMLPGNVCIKCHSTKGHKAHPEYDK